MFFGIKKKKLINEYGVSVYHPAEAIYCLKIKNLKHIQIPFNLLDLRWLKNKKFLKLIKKRKDVKIHVRSIFLRGLLLRKFNFWPKWFKNRKKVVQNIEYLQLKLKKKKK